MVYCFHAVLAMPSSKTLPTFSFPEVLTILSFWVFMGTSDRLTKFYYTGNYD